MIKKTLAGLAVTASVIGTAGLAASPAVAVGGDDERGARTDNGNGSMDVLGNTTTGGYMSPNMSLINGSFNEFCLPIPAQADVQNVAGVVNVGVQELLASQNQQNCVENSSQVDGDDPLSHVLSDIPLFSENGVSSH